MTSIMGSPREGFGSAILELAKQDSSIVVLCADLTESIRLQDFKDTFPERFIEIGVAEQNMMSVAAGLALSGKIPFVCSFAVFNPGRNWDQLRVSVCYANANVKIIGAHAGLSVGPDGATHQALEDVAITRVLPNLTVLTPTDSFETGAAVRFAKDHQGPVYIRFGRDSVPTLSQPDQPLELGVAKLYKNGSDVAICASGAMVSCSIRAAEILESEGIHAAVVAFPFVKPLDTSILSQLALTCGCMVVAEDAQVAGSLGGAIAEYCSETCPVPIKRIGVFDRFGQSGTTQELYNEYGLTAENIVKAAKESIDQKRARVY